MVGVRLYYYPCIRIHGHARPICFKCLAFSTGSFFFFLYFDRVRYSLNAALNCHALTARLGIPNNAGSKVYRYAFYLDAVRRLLPHERLRCLCVYAAQLVERHLACYITLSALFCISIRRAPHGARRREHVCALHPALYFNPRAPHGARHGCDQKRQRDRGISIHAPRMGRDLRDLASSALSAAFQSTRPAWGATPGTKTSVARSKISIHAPRMGRDTNASTVTVAAGQFQSTRPAWGATHS